MDYPWQLMDTREDNVTLWAQSDPKGALRALWWAVCPPGSEPQHADSFICRRDRAETEFYVKRIVIVWRDEHAGKQFQRQFGTDWADVLREIHAERQCDCCAPTAFAPNGAKAWIGEDGQLVLGNNWKE